MKKEYSCKVISKNMLNCDTAYLTIKCPDIASSAVPGQFVNISCSRFLKRPFGIASVDKANGTFDIGVKVVGKGTVEIAAFEEGQDVEVLGPLGNGFTFDASKNYILVAGGTGVFPINFASQYLREKNINFKVVEGFRNASQVVLNEPDYVLCTDAGDIGIKGTCIAGLDTLDEDFVKDSILCCVGPLPMMKACGNWATEKGIPSYVSMEQRMGCGIGICLVCVCKLKAEANGEEFKHVRCCKEGPVFPFEEVIF